jgi:hypothetical protein
LHLGKLTSIAAAGIVVAAATTALGLGLRPPADPQRSTARDNALSGSARDAGTGSGSQAAGDPAPEPKQRGVALGLFAEDVGFSYLPLLREIAGLGASHVALVVPIYQADEHATDLTLHTRFSPTLGLLADTIRAAKRERLEVTLLPIVRLIRAAPGQWRGTLAPADSDRWFQSYGELLGDLAAVAAQTGVTRLVVGSELSSLDGDLERWRPLLERIRAIFPGHLVYSANWDHYRQARLLDLVDEDGVVAYFNLRDSPRAPATDLALEAAWRLRKEELLGWHADRTHPLVFTEVGYRSRAGSTAAPWDETAGGTVDLDEQRRAFTAFRRVWSHSPSLDGAYVWNWYGWGGPSSVGYTPRGKPAAQEIALLLEGL